VASTIDLASAQQASRSAARSGLKPLSWILLALLLIPSLAQVWQQRDLPRFGDFHDDSVYYVTAKSLASGAGYRIESLPGEPAQTKYPPLYPLLLSIAWKLDPQFPRNLTIAAWLSWLALPAVLFQLPALFRRLGFSTGRTWLVLILFAVNPYVALFSTQLLSEMLFLALIVTAMLLIERAVDGEPRAFLAAAAGVAGGLAYLTRSAGIVLFVAAIVYLWMIRKERRAAGFFAAGMLPFVAGWTLWSRMHQLPTSDPSLIYYTDYFRNQLYSLSWSDLHLYIWRNIDSLLWGLGGLIVPKVTGSWFLKILSQVIAVAMMSGIVRMVRRGQGALYAMFAAIGAALLCVCTFPANERLTLPFFPLALAGLVVEMQHFFETARVGLRHKDRSQRIAASCLIGVFALILLGALALQIYVGQVFMNDDAQHHRERTAARIPAYEWARANLPADASVLATEDVMFYLHTGRHAMRASLPPQLWYREDRAGIVNWFTDLKPFAQNHGLSYVEFSGADVTQGVDDEAADAIEKKTRNHLDLKPLFETPASTIYQVR
jgi:hypothetical protein